MDKYSRYYGVIIFSVVLFLTMLFGFNILSSSIHKCINTNKKLVTTEQTYSKKLEQKKIVENKLERIRLDSETMQKRLYAPLDSDLGNDTLFFTLYNDLIEIIHSNSIKIKSMEYIYNPDDDPFVKFSKELYFVSEVDMELVSNYTNLGKFIQEIVQYPYYLKVQSVDIKPYPKDKKILIANVSIKLYARTTPEILPEDSSAN